MRVRDARVDVAAVSRIHALTCTGVTRRRIHLICIRCRRSRFFAHRPFYV